MNPTPAALDQRWTKWPRPTHDALLKAHIFNKTWEEHVKAVRHLFVRAAKHNVSLHRKKKWKLAQKTVRFEGYVVSENRFKLKTEDRTHQCNQGISDTEEQKQPQGILQALLVGR